MLTKAHFKYPETLTKDQLLSALSAMAKEAARTESKYQAKKGELKILREDLKDLRERGEHALAAHEAGGDVWLLKNGRVSVEGPDGQGLLLAADEVEDPTAREPARPTVDERPTEPAPKARRGKRATASVKA